MSNFIRADAIEQNKRIYDATAPLYEERHGEIFNPTEQARIYATLQECCAFIATGAEVPRVLDFGAGTGNLTRHLLVLGAQVVAADVSKGCLKELRQLAEGQGRFETMELNGRDLAGAATASFDMVVTYSVLHHVPDYLAAVKEFVRVVKPGGIIYIDHEVCPAYWEEGSAYAAYSRELAEAPVAAPLATAQKILALFSRKNKWDYLLAAAWLKRHKVQDEGDIHVYQDDHIEWDAIRSLLVPSCQILREDDYLVCREIYQPPPVWEHWHGHCADMRLIVARKNRQCAS